MGLPFSKLFLFLAAGAGIGATPAFADVNSCVQTNSKFIKTIDEQLKSFGVDPRDPCPEQKMYDRAQNNCEKNLSQLREIDGRLRGIMKEKCQNAEEITKAAAANSGKQDDSMNKASDVNKRGADINKREYETLGQLSQKVKEMRKFYAELAQGAKEIQEKVTDKASQDPQGKDEHTDRLRDAGSHRGSAPVNNEQAKNFFKDSLGTVASMVSKARDGGISKADVDQIKTPLTAEPLKIAAAADDWDKQIQARQKVVQSQGSLYGENKNTTNERSGNLGDSNKNQTGGQAASSNGSGSGSGGDGAGANMGQAAQAMQAASGLAGGGSGSGSGGSSGGTGEYGSYADNSGSGNSYGSTAGGAGGSAGPNSYSSKTGQSNGTGGDGTNKIANLDNIVKGDGKNGDVVTTGASASPGKGSSLRDAMRERLSQYSSGGGSGGSSGATEGGGSGGTGANASSGAVPTGLLPATASVASDNPLEASSGSVGGDLGNTDFSLAGSDTDAAVKGMLKDFGLGDGEGGRGPASEAEHQAPEILASDSPSLFMRTRETHLRSLKKGLVINGLRAKL